MKTLPPSFNPVSTQDVWTAFQQIIYDYMNIHLFTCTPVEVIAVNQDGSVDVRSLLMLKTTAGDVLPPQEPVFHVPVFIFRGGGCDITLPVSIGDKGLLLSCKYDPSAYFETHDLSPTSSSRLFSLSNGVFLPLDFGYSPNGITLRNGASSIVLKAREIILTAAENTEENPSSSSLVLTPSSLSGVVQGSVSVQADSCEVRAQSACVEAQAVSLGGPGGAGIARIGDTVVVGGVSGTITTGSAVVTSV